MRSSTAEEDMALRLLNLATVGRHLLIMALLKAMVHHKASMDRKSSRGSSTQIAHLTDIA